MAEQQSTYTDVPLPAAPRPPVAARGTGYTDVPLEGEHAAGYWSRIVDTVTAPATMIKSIVAAYSKPPTEMDPVEQLLTMEPGQGPLSYAAFAGYEISKGVVKASLNQWQKGKEAWAKGNHSEAIGHGTAALLPLMALAPGVGPWIGGVALGAPATAEAAEELPTNPRAALGTMTGTVALPAAGKYVAEVARTGSLLPTAAKVKASPPLSVRIPAVAANPNPEEAAAASFAAEHGIPVSAATASGNSLIAGAEKGVEHTTLAGSLVGRRAGAAHEAAVERVGGELAGEVNAPTPVVPRAPQPGVVETPETAGQSVKDALHEKAAAHHEEASTAYGNLRAIEESEAAKRTIQTGVERSPETGRMQKKYETFQLATDLGAAQNALKPILTRIEKWMPQAQQQASPALAALRNIVNGPRYMNATDVDAALSALKNEVRGADAPYFRDLSQGLAARQIGVLERAVGNALEDYPEAATALKTGREATKAKYAVKDVLDQLPDEPVQAFKKLTTAGDRNVNLLRSVVAQSPDAGPTLGRAFMQDMLERGDSGRAWFNLGNQTKKLLVPDAELRGALDKFWLYKRMAARNPNPSGTAYVGGTLAHAAGFLVTDPVTHVQYEIAGGVLSTMLHNPTVVKLLTRGMTIQLGSAKAAETASAIRAAAGEATPAAGAATGGGEAAATGLPGEGRLGRLWREESGFAAMRTAPLDPEKAAATRGTSYMVLGLNKVDWSKRMIAEGVSPADLPRVRTLSEKLLETQLNKAAEQMPNAKKLMADFEAGRADMTWYDKTADELKDLFGDDAKLMANVLAATSINATVKSNVSLALRAYQYIKEGRSFDALPPGERFLPAVTAELKRAAAGEELAGRKVNNFAKAVSGDPDAVVVDRVMLRAFGFKHNAATPHEYDMIENAVRTLAKDADVAPRQLQAAIWFATKKRIDAPGRPESPPFGAELLKRREEALRTGKPVPIPSVVDVGITSSRPGRPSAQVYEDMKGFSAALAKAPGVEAADVKPGIGAFQGGSEPTWVTHYVEKTPGAADKLLAETAQKYDQDAVLVTRRGGKDVETNLIFPGALNRAQREAIGELLIARGIGGWTWYRAGRQTVLRAVSVPQWGGEAAAHEAAVRAVSAELKKTGLGHELTVNRVTADVMEKGGEHSYEKVLNRGKESRQEKLDFGGAPKTAPREPEE